MFSVIVPVRNEPGVNWFLLDLHRVLAGIPDGCEVLVVMGDGETLHCPVNPMPRQRVITTYADSLERSILNGFSQARGERILCMDSDGSHPVEYVPRMWRMLDDYEMVVGSRFVKGAANDSAPFRRLVTWGCCFMAHRAGSKLMDPMSGFFAIRREVLDRCRFKPITWKTGLEIELRAKPRVKEIPIAFRERYSDTAGASRSKASLKTGVKILWQLLTEALS